MDWKDCVVIYIDLPCINTLIKNALKKEGPKASSLMMKFRDLVQMELRQSENLTNIKHAYVWNDSVALLSYEDGTTASFRAFLWDADRLKQKIDSLTEKWGCAPAYGIAVKGQAFPSKEQSSGERVTVLRTSSYAMANCFEIEKAAKKQGLKKSWYVDNLLKKCLDKRLVVPSRRRNNPLRVKLLPKNRERKIHLIDGYLWNED